MEQVSLTGYRTFIVFGLVTVFGLFGKHLPPDIIQDYATDIIELAGLAGIGMRMITGTEFGKKGIQEVEKMGVPDDLVEKFIAALPAQADLGDLLAKLEEVKKTIAGQQPIVVVQSAAAATPTAVIPAVIPMSAIPTPAMPSVPEPSAAFNPEVLPPSDTEVQAAEIPVISQESTAGDAATVSPSTTTTTSALNVGGPLHV